MLDVFLKKNPQTPQNILPPIFDLTPTLVSPIKLLKKCALAGSRTRGLRMGGVNVTPTPLARSKIDGMHSIIKIFTNFFSTEKSLRFFQFNLFLSRAHLSSSLSYFRMRAKQLTTYLEFQNRIGGSLWGLFIGDALAMPAHWYYNRAQLRKDFGKITTYQAPTLNLPGSILNVSNTGGGGRGSDEGNIIGDIICHGKKKYWLRSGSYFYHCTLQKAENTLEVQLTRLLLRHIASQSKSNVGNGYQFNAEKYREEFVEFMLRPGSHNDTFASTYIRMFFANFVKGKALDQCPDNDGHNVDTIDALTSLSPIVIASLLPFTTADQEQDQNELIANEQERVKQNTWRFLQCLRRTNELRNYGDRCSELIYQLIRFNDVHPSGIPLTPAERIQYHTLQTAQSMGYDLNRLLQSYQLDDPMTACYIHSSFPALLVFLYKYAHDPHQCLIASVNAGGENVARSAVIGSILGAAYGLAAWKPRLVFELHDHTAIAQEISSFVSLFDSDGEYHVKFYHDQLESEGSL